MSYTTLLEITLVTMLVLAFAYFFFKNSKLAKLLQVAAIALAAIGFYFHAQAQAHGEYHRIGQAVGEYVVYAMQHFGKTGIGRIFIAAINYAQHHEWVINTLVIVIFILISIFCHFFKDKRRK